MRERVARWLIGPTVFVIVIWAVGSSGRPWWVRALVATLVVTVVASVWTLLPAGRRLWAMPVRKGWWMHAVRATTSVGETLDRMGAAGHDVRSGTRLVLAWSSTEVELWHEDDVLTRFRWDEAQLAHVTGDAGWRRAQCVGLYVRNLYPLVLMPDHRTDGSPFPATRWGVATLLLKLERFRQAALPPPPLLTSRQRVLVLRDDSVEDDGRRVVDLELSAAVLHWTRVARGELSLRPDERPAEVQPAWTKEELGALARHIYFVEIDKVPVARGASVRADADRVRTHLRERYPQLTEAALDHLHHDYCFRNR